MIVPQHAAAAAAATAAAGAIAITYHKQHSIPPALRGRLASGLGLQEHEKRRQRDSLILIASENLTSKSVYDALGSIM